MKPARARIADLDIHFVVLRPREAVCAARAAARTEGRITDYGPYRDFYASFDETPEQFVVARWNDPEHLRRRVEEFKGRIAAIVFEPVLCNTCCIEPVVDLMRTIRELCDRDIISSES